MIIATELELLGPDDRRAADAQMFRAAAGLGDHQLREHARAIAMRLDDDAAPAGHPQRPRHAAPGVRGAEHG